MNVGAAFLQVLVGTKVPGCINIQSPDFSPVKNCSAVGEDVVGFVLLSRPVAVGDLVRIVLVVRISGFLCCPGLQAVFWVSKVRYPAFCP